MKKTLITFICAAALTPQAQDLMDEKIANLCFEQRKEIFEKISEKDFDAINSFWETQNYRSKMSNKKIDDFSFNEMIEIIDKEKNEAIMDLKHRFYRPRCSTC